MDLSKDLSNIFRLVNVAVGAIMVLGGISQFFGGITMSSAIVGVYVILFGLATGGLEFIPHVPTYLSRHASFLFSFLGRGIFYVFIGSIILEGHVLRIIAGSIVGIVGLGYVALEYIPSIEPPVTMREADSTWGSEQV
ncbi:Late Golgi vesicles protein [Onygenales sp. PD_40]|nr:Late Golgi vesicles protein [Onygenales sp. PD_40]KAK2761849.1 Late Golgi vesicles protein [Emmonsiellopsis sp. PD_33]KAK2781840.1 Late Golgi vesicles protein [Onygenales sp. PD_12]KAK2803285.1 Late Golgi vesicles protein [Onygenales sp. PD_10]